MKPPFRQALGIIQRLKQHGHEAYFVGGAVRDLLLGRPIGDVDIATGALPEEVMAIFPKTIDVGSKHGTVVVVHEGKAYEVTTFRTDGDYEDYRRPESVTFVRSLEEDLKRRDFTMNAMAMDEHGTVIDPFGGQEAIEKRIIAQYGNVGAVQRCDNRQLADHLPRQHGADGMRNSVMGMKHIEPFPLRHLRDFAR